MTGKEKATEPKAGMFTSEFFVTVGVLLTAAVLAVTGVITPEQWEEVTKWAAGGYAVSRGIAKINN